MASYTVTAHTRTLISGLSRFLVAWESDKLRVQAGTMTTQQLRDKWSQTNAAGTGLFDRNANLVAEARKELEKASLVSLVSKKAQWMADDHDFSIYDAFAQTYTEANHAILQHQTYFLKKPQETVAAIQEVNTAYCALGLKPEDTVSGLRTIPGGAGTDSELWDDIDKMLNSKDPIERLFARTADYAEIANIKKDKRLPVDSKYFPQEFRDQRIKQAKQYASQNSAVTQTLTNSKTELAFMLDIPERPCVMTSTGYMTISDARAAGHGFGRGAAGVVDDISKFADTIIMDEMDTLLKANDVQGPNPVGSIGEEWLSRYTLHGHDNSRVALNRMLRANYSQIDWEIEVPNQDGLIKPLIDHMFDFCAMHAVQHTKATLEKYAYDSKRENWTKDASGNEIKGWLNRRKATKEGEKRREALNKTMNVPEISRRYGIEIETCDSSKKSGKDSGRKPKAGLKWLKEAYEAAKNNMLASLYSEKRELTETDKARMRQQLMEARNLSDRLVRYFFEVGAGGLENDLRVDPNNLYRQVCDVLGIDYNNVQLLRRQIANAPADVVTALSRCPASTYATWETPEEAQEREENEEIQERLSILKQEDQDQQSARAAAQAANKRHLAEAVKSCKAFFGDTSGIGDEQEQVDYLDMVFGNTKNKLDKIVKRWWNEGINVGLVEARCSRVRAFTSSADHEFGL